MLTISPSADCQPLTSPQVLILWLHFHRLVSALLHVQRVDPAPAVTLENLKICFRRSLRVPILRNL